MLQSSKKGFTIIEVVIVLVIGAIIMLMVFLIVPQLQRSQRDARRQQDARQLITAAEQSATQNNGTYVSTAAEILAVAQQFIRNPFDAPNGGAYTFTVTVGSGAGNNIVYVRDGRCGANGAVVDGGGNREIAVSVDQENGAAFCVQN